jgi:hypothetical protein
VDATAIEERIAEYFANWDIRLPEGAVELEDPGVIRQSGWAISYVFGNDARGPYLEFYATHRMTDDRRVRIYSSGETQPLEALQTMYAYDPRIPGAQERAAKENRKRNMQIAKELEARGLYPVGNVNAYLATHDVPKAGGTPPPARRRDRAALEREARAAGYTLIAGVDEGGRAAWAGPMVGAAVILPEDIDPRGLRDGKKKSPTSRLAAFERIKNEAIAIGVAQVSPADMDRVGIDACHLQLLHVAVAMALSGVDVLTDARKPRGTGSRRCSPRRPTGAFALLSGPAAHRVGNAEVGVPFGRSAGNDMCLEDPLGGSLTAVDQGQ